MWPAGFWCWIKASEKKPEDWQHLNHFHRSFDSDRVFRTRRLFVCVCFVLLLPHSTYLASDVETVKAENNKPEGQPAVRMPLEMMTLWRLLYSSEVIRWIWWMWLKEAEIHSVSASCSCFSKPHTWQNENGLSGYSTENDVESWLWDPICVHIAFEWLSCVRLSMNTHYYSLVVLLQLQNGCKHTQSFPQQTYELSAEVFMLTLAITNVCCVKFKFPHLPWQRHSQWRKRRHFDIS